MTFRPKFISLRGNFTYSPWTLATFADTFIIFKISHLGVLKFSFSHFAHSIQKILIECQFYPKTTRRFGNSVVMESGVKLEL